MTRTRPSDAEGDQRAHTIHADGSAPLRSTPKTDLIFDYDTPLSGHANGMILMATDAQGDVTLRETYYSIGGGFVMTEAELAAGKDTDEGAPVPFPFKSAAEMLEMAKISGKSIAGMKRANEIVARWRDPPASGHATAVAGDERLHQPRAGDRRHPARWTVGQTPRQRHP